LKYTIAFFCTLSLGFSYCQKINSLSIEINKAGYGSDSSSIYNVSISNFSDSIICVLHSRFVSLDVGNSPQALAATANNDDTVFYNLEQAVKDTFNTYEGLLYRGTIILPYLSLNFRIKVDGSSEKQILSIEYFQLFDIRYRKFEYEELLGRWHEKYNRSIKNILLPK